MQAMIKLQIANTDIITSHFGDGKSETQRLGYFPMSQ